MAKLTLGDVLAQPEFGLELSAGGAAAWHAPVEGAHNIDLRDPVRWLQESWIMLTTGVQLRGDAAAQRRLVTQLAEGRITALGLGLGIALRRVPRALLQECERRDFPLFVVPLDTPFRDILSFVNRSALSADLYLLRRLTSMQRYLLDAMREPLPDQALVDRLASLLGGADVAYLDADGAPISTTATDIDWSAVVARHGSSVLREFEQDGRSGLIAPVVDANTPSRSLAVFLGSVTLSPQMARPVVRTASELLAVISVTRLAVARDRRARSERLGARVLRVLDGERDDGLAAALAVDGIDFTRPCRLAILAPDSARAREDLTSALADAGVEFVIAGDGARIVVLAQDELDRFERWLPRDPGTDAISAGVSDPMGRLEALPTAVAQARLALAVAQARPGPVAQRHGELDASVALLGSSSEDVRRRLVRALSPLDREPRLRAAVVAYLDAELDVGRAAHTLGLHRNTVRYRLDRAEALLGCSLRAPATVATLHLALVAERLAAVAD